MEPDESSSLKENDPQPATPPPDQVDALLRDLGEYKDKYLRLLAEWENGKKHLQKERGEISKYAVERTILEFLQPLDQFENALKLAEGQTIPQEVKNWAIGFQLILSQFRDVLAQNGVTPFESKGQVFNPFHHDAVEVIETNAVPAGTVVEEYTKGYKMGERILRAARVTVAKAPQEDLK